MPQLCATALAAPVVKAAMHGAALTKQPLPCAKRPCAVQLAVYCCLLGMGVYALHDQPWLWDSSYFWRDWPRHTPP